jgi:hypothetical protein
MLAPSVRYVESFEELLSAAFEGEINALCWRRTLPGDYAEVLAALKLPAGITSLDDETLLALKLSPAGQVAVQTMLADLELLRAAELEPVLDGIHGYVEEEQDEVIRTDVRSWHVDSATAQADTFLCTYHGACSQALHPAQAIRRCDVPATRAALLADYGGAEDEGFAEYLADHCYDLHYEATADAQLIDFGVGSLWRIAVQWEGSPVAACVHRAPEPVLGQQRLLLIS